VRISAHTNVKKNRLSSNRVAEYSKSRRISFLRKYSDDLFWTRDLSSVMKAHQVNYLKLTQNLLQRKEKRRTKPVIVEFGPGKGLMINQLSKLREAEYYGFANLSDSDWVNHRNVKYIQEPIERFNNYFKEDSIDFLFSATGLAHTQSFDQTINNILPTLRPNGKLITDFFTKEGSTFESDKPKIISVGQKQFKITTAPTYITFGGNKLKVDPTKKLLIFERIK
jgi:SAM-dependent methyltransferase